MIKPNNIIGLVFGILAIWVLTPNIFPFAENTSYIPEYYVIHTQYDNLKLIGIIAIVLGIILIISSNAEQIKQKIRGYTNVQFKG